MNEMEAEIAIDYNDDHFRGYVEVAVNEGETNADIYIEDGENDEPVKLRLSADELRNLVASLGRALKTVEANS